MARLASQGRRAASRKRVFEDDPMPTPAGCDPQAKSGRSDGDGDDPAVDVLPAVAEEPDDIAVPCVAGDDHAPVVADAAVPALPAATSEADARAPPESAEPSRASPAHDSTDAAVEGDAQDAVPNGAPDAAAQLVPDGA